MKANIARAIVGMLYVIVATTLKDKIGFESMVIIMLCTILLYQTFPTQPID